MSTTKHAVQQWCSEATLATIEAATIIRPAVEGYLTRRGLTLAGDITIEVRDIRTGSHVRLQHDHPEGAPLLVMATFQARPVDGGDAGAHGSPT